jgi:hypothetical protein
VATYVIAKKNRGEWDLPVFHAGERGDDEAIAAFTGAGRAADYLRAAQMQDDHDVHEVTAIELFEIMVEAHEEEIRYLAVNPDRASHSFGKKQPVIVLKEQLHRFADLLVRDIHIGGLRFQDADSA